MLFLMMVCAVFSGISIHAEDNEVQVYRLYNQWNGEHLFTTDNGEYENLGNAGWNKEGTAWISASVGNEPVYRLFNPYNSEHH